MGKDLIVKENSAMDNALPLQAIAEQVKAVHELMSSLMRENEHYGIIPGTQKPTLLKAGAEKICMMFQLRPEYKIKRVNLNKGHTEYEIVCEIYNKQTKMSWGQGVGSCSTLESKFRYRYENPKCPECGSGSIIKGKNEYGGGWICWAKKGGCGERFDDSHSFKQKKIDNPDIADIYNTVLKMAKKRALLDAVITATAASDIFTQDMDELKGMTSSPKSNVNPEPNGNGNKTPTKKTQDKIDKILSLPKSIREKLVKVGKDKVIDAFPYCDHHNWEEDIIEDDLNFLIENMKVGS